MKKILLVLMASFLSACQVLQQGVFNSSVSQSSSSSKATQSQKAAKASDNTQIQTQNLFKQADFVGSWVCETDGDKIGTSNQVNLTQDGKAEYVGKITVPKAEPLFQYEVQRAGTWALNNDVLSYIFNSSNVQRANTEEMLRKIKTSVEINAAENDFFAELKTSTQNSDGKPVNMTVSNFTGDTFTITQKNRSGQCTRVVK